MQTLWCNRPFAWTEFPLPAFAMKVRGGGKVGGVINTRVGMSILATRSCTCIGWFFVVAFAWGTRPRTAFPVGMVRGQRASCNRHQKCPKVVAKDRGKFETQGLHVPRRWRGPVCDTGVPKPAVKPVPGGTECWPFTGFAKKRCSIKRL